MVEIWIYMVYLFKNLFLELIELLSIILLKLKLKKCLFNMFSLVWIVKEVIEGYMYIKVFIVCWFILVRWS